MPSFGPQRNAAVALSGLALTLFFILPVPVNAQEAVVAAAAPDAAASQDYYTRRASETLKRDEKLNAFVPHPLAAAYPNHSVVVCEAGCLGERGAEVVFMERRQADAQASRSASAAAKQAATIYCVGGCYDTPRRYEAAHMAGPPSARPGQAKLLNPDHERFDPRY
jgi:hypothetical protein